MVRRGRFSVPYYSLSSHTMFPVKQNASFWIGVAVIALVGISLVFLMMNNAHPGAYTPTSSATTTTTNTPDGATGGTQKVGAKPMVLTSEFASVSSTTAVVAGTVMPNGAQTTYWFEYGPTMSYGLLVDKVTASPTYKTLGAGGYIKGLKPHTEYYFRIGAQNAYGTVYGTQYKFITASN